jgi:hypothetical protein
MKKYRPFSRIVIISAICLTSLIHQSVSGQNTKENVLALHPENPHYFIFRGRPQILITSAEHYGAVINLDFDYIKYLNTLARDGMNHTRIFSGAVYVEPQGAFNIIHNTLAPAPGWYLAPWARSETPGYRGGGNKFDLSRWDENYFARLRSFMTEASRRGIIVEVNLFCPQYSEAQWQVSPFNPVNNINSTGPPDRLHVCTLDKNAGGLVYQEKFVRRLVSELNRFDNFYYEITNEPWADNIPMPWQNHIADIIAESEKTLPVKHLISLNISNYAEKVEQLHPAVSILNFHYATPPDTVVMNYSLNKLIGDNETGFRGNDDAPYRMEGWDFIIAGGGLYNNLDYSFTTETEDGTTVAKAPTPGGGSPSLRKQLRILRNFIYGFDFLKMKPDNSIIRGGIPESHSARALVDPGRSYALYIRPMSYAQFSARYTGMIEAKHSEEYTFHTTSNDGVRLWVDNQLVLENWTDHSATEDKGTIQLQAGKKYPIRLEYFYAGGWGQMILKWSSARQEKQVIPAGAFSLPDSAGSGLKAEYFSDTTLTQIRLTRSDPEINFNWGTGFSMPGSQKTVSAGLQLELPAGKYRAEWVDPLSGRVTRTEKFQHTGGVRVLAAPDFSADIALRIKRR